MKSRFIRFFLCFSALFLCFSFFGNKTETGGEFRIDYYADYQAAAPGAAEAVSTDLKDGKTEHLVGAVNSFAWGPAMLLLLMGTGVWFSVRTGFFQFRKFRHMLKITLGAFTRGKCEEQKGSITPFQALTTAMAATVGTGNIAGVSSAIIIGGPGSVFWMWVSAVFGMMTKFAEVVLAVRYRERNKGEWVGGPMYYIKNGLGGGWKWLGALFSVFGALAAFGIGNTAQVSTITSAVINAADTFSEGGAGIYERAAISWAVGIVIAIITGLVIFGGVKRIGRVTEKLVPFMSVLYIAGTLVIILSNLKSFGPVFISIIESAFTPRAVIGGVSGFYFLRTVRLGVGRGIFSNEAGLGSAPIAYASTSDLNPVRQGLYGIFEVFADTLVICTLTAFAILMSGISIPWGDAGVGGAVVASNAFATIFGEKVSSLFTAFSILCFAAASVFSWALYGQRCFGYLTGERCLGIYKAVFILLVVVGATQDLALIWEAADALNGLMAVPNLIAILGLSGEVISLTKKYSEKSWACR
ncbi:MAG: alanine/glycine:cation symporter family protein [Oscillospiraceae bacterium]|jgi:AGCS family alanine or glycine:cation symporter